MPTHFSLSMYCLFIGHSRITTSQSLVQRQSRRKVSQPYSNSTWEGIREGWYFSELGGGSKDRRKSAVKRRFVLEDNKDVGSPESDRPVPSIFNGNFEWGNMHRKTIPNSFGDLFYSNRFPFSYEMPGWSYHGGSGFTIAGVDVTSALCWRPTFELTSRISFLPT